MSDYNEGALVSVIVPNYNHGAYLKQRLDSVFNQSYLNFEVIILDDHSTDNSREIIEQYRQSNKIAHIVYNDKNSGSPFMQWKKGIDLARGEYIWLAESDDHADHRFLETCMKQINHHKDVSVVYTDSYIIDESGKILHENLNWWLYPVNDRKWTADYCNNGLLEIKEALCIQNTIPNASSVVFRKQFHDDVLSFRYAGDWFFWIKMLEQGNVCFVKRSLNYFRSHNQSTRNYEALDKKRSFFKEKMKVVQYLKRNNYLNRPNWKKHYSVLFNEWVRLFTIFEVFNSKFFVPFNSPGWLLAFFYFKVTDKLKLKI